MFLLPAVPPLAGSEAGGGVSAPDSRLAFSSASADTAAAETLSDALVASTLSAFSFRDWLS